MQLTIAQPDRRDVEAQRVEPPPPLFLDETPPRTLDGAGDHDAEAAAGLRGEFHQTGIDAVVAVDSNCIRREDQRWFPRVAAVMPGWTGEITSRAKIASASDTAWSGPA
ncbi:MAG TPA: hypothetical protein PLV68_04440, partial [Ilumatobacteraceae bacterium]|nr:hypothetical protein [Ilumatobacteraceae bacterium]